MAVVILAVCLNPAVDITYRTPAVQGHASQAVELVCERAGGKGVNVARVLQQAGAPVVLTGLAGGECGDALDAELVSSGIETSLIPIEGTTRRCVTVVDSVDATVFNERGPTVTCQEWSRFADRFRILLADAEVVTLSGSIPLVLPSTAYECLTRMASRARVPVLLDAHGAPLALALAAGPDIVAPNRAEATDALGIPVERLDLRSCAAQLRALGAEAASQAAAAIRPRHACILHPGRPPDS